MATKKSQSTRRESKAQKKQMGRSKAQCNITLTPRLPVVELYQKKRQMREQVAKDRARRYKEFLAQIKNPTELPAPGIALRAIAPPPGKQNLRILAEGDSWFEYPLPITHGDGVIYQLQKLLSYGIANMASLTGESMRNAAV
jgi:hypothetical protein